MQDTPQAVGNRSDAIVARHRGLFLRTVLVSVLTLASRVLGLLREVLTAMLFGDKSPILDAFMTAFRIPNLMRRLFGEGALATSLTSALTSEDHQRGDAAGRHLFGRVLRFANWVLTAIAAIGMLALLLAIPTLGSGWLGEWEGAAAAIELTMLLLPFVVWICLAALAAGALNVRGHFFAPTAAPVAMNVLWLLGLLLLLLVWPAAEPMEQMRVLAWIVLVAGASQFALQWPALFRHGLFVWPSRNEPQVHSQESAWGVVKQALPLALGAAVYQLNVVIDGLMAEALLPVGGPSAQYYANRIQQFPLALVAAAATSSVFPALRALAQVGRLDELRALHDRTQLAVAYLALPASTGLLFLAPEISIALFEHGKYGAEGTQRIAAALAMSAFSLFPVGAVGLASRVYYARGDFSTPVRISVLTLVSNTLLNFLFVRGLGMDVEGLSLGTAIASWLNLLLLVPGFSRRLGLPSGSAGQGGRYLRQLLCALGSGLLAWGTAQGVAAILGWERGPLTAAVALAPALAVALGAQILGARLLGLEEWRMLRERWQRRGQRRTR
jgi:putative peptidoglycan lipid II flippase